VAHDRDQNYRVSFFRRAAACAIDFVVVWGTWFAGLVLLIGIEHAVGYKEANGDSTAAEAIFFLSIPAFWLIYQWFCNARGVSMGKRVLSLVIVRVESLDSLPAVRPGIRTGFLRTLGQVLGAVPLGLGFWWALWDSGGRTWADRMAGTRVVRAGRLANLGEVRFKYRASNGAEKIPVLVGFAALLSLLLALRGDSLSAVVIEVSAIVGFCAFLMIVVQSVSYVELRQTEVRFQYLGWNRWSLPYDDIENVKIEMDGIIELKFRGRNRRGRPNDRIEALVLENSEAFVTALELRVQAARGQPLSVVS
jgi:hypothetical protein